MIFYLRCAAYLRLLPRTRTQIQRAQTHSRRRAMLAAVTKINLPSCLGFCFRICPHLLDGTVCHACTQADDIIFVMSHAQIYIEQRMTLKLKSTETMLSAYMHVWHAVRRVNGWLFHCVNTENEASCQGKRLSKRPSFTSFCASGNDLFFRRGNERDENDVKRG